MRRGLIGRSAKFNIERRYHFRAVTGGESLNVDLKMTSSFQTPLLSDREGGYVVPFKCNTGNWPHAMRRGRSWVSFIQVDLTPLGG